jgi:hypothetical protein
MGEEGGLHTSFCHAAEGPYRQGGRERGAVQWCGGMSMFKDELTQGS